MQHDFNTSIVHEVSHRPWPMPARPWIMTQTWHDLLFAHWPVDAKQLAARIPAEFELDVFDGQAWLGIVPFDMTNVSVRGLPALPWLSAFPELNVRTYVRVEDKPGVYFFSLDAGNPIAVQAARILLRLPYCWASMRVERSVTGVRYRSYRKGSGPSAELVATYGPTGPVFNAQRGSLEYFLAERYCLYARGHTGPYRLEIHHSPWPLQPAEAELEINSMAGPSGIRLPDVTPLLHFAKRQDTVAWAPSRLGMR